MVTKRPRYSEIGEEVSMASAYIQAASALDVAAFLAEEGRDTKTLLEVATIFIAMGDRLSGDHEEPEEEGKEFEFGFAADAVSDVVHEPEEEVEYIDEEEEE